MRYLKTYEQISIGDYYYFIVTHDEKYIFFDHLQHDKYLFYPVKGITLDKIMDNAFPERELSKARAYLNGINHEILYDDPSIQIKDLDKSDGYGETRDYRTDNWSNFREEENWSILKEYKEKLKLVKLFVGATQDFEIDL